MLILIIALVVLLGLLFGLDRAAAAYAAGRIATKLQAQGFPVRPSVTVEGFPFLTQLISRHLDGIEVTAPRFPVGQVTASIRAHATDITLDSGYQSGTIAQVTGTGLISFASLGRLPALAGVPGLKIGSDGLHWFHEGDTCHPVEPSTLLVRLQTLGFGAVMVAVDEVLTFTARKPGAGWGDREP